MVLHIVASHWKEDLEWLKKSKWPVIVIDKEGADPSWVKPQHIIPNKGKEATAYLKYIIENYDELPDHVAFIHGHEESYHQKHDRPLLEMIEHANIDKHGFIPLNNCMRWYINVDEGGPWGKNFTCAKIFGFPDHMRRPEGFIFSFPTSAQFIVSKEKILGNSKELYEKWYYIFMNIDYFGSDAIYPFFFEAMWHVIFGEPWRFINEESFFKVKTLPVHWMHKEYPEWPFPFDILNYRPDILELNKTIEGDRWQWATR